MKTVIRRCIFESNSSTSHTVVIMTEEQNEKWKEEDLYYYPYHDWYDPFKKLPENQKPKSGCLYTQDEVLKFHKLQGYEPNPEEYDEDEFESEEDMKDIFIKEMGDFIKYTQWFEDEYLETDENHFTTPGGEKIVVCCKYGRDG